MIIRPNRTIPVMAVFAFFALSQPLFAATPGLVDAYNAEQAIRAELNAGNVATPAQAALNVLVARGIENLAAVGETTLATQLDREWNSGFVNYLPRHLVSDAAKPMGVSFLDIGDHDPLSPWLAKFHDTLAAKTMGMIDGIQIINDIFTMNYALGVALYPKASSWKANYTGQEIEWEYRKHFIPMANIISYWVTLEACDAIAKSQLPAAQRFCGLAASKLEFYMGRYWAPKISDYVYEKANGIYVGRHIFLALAAKHEFSVSESDFEKEVLSSLN